MSIQPDSFLDRPPHIYWWRPVYRYVVTPYFHPLLSWLRVFFTSPLYARIEAAERNAVMSLHLESKKLEVAFLAKAEASHLDSLGQWSAMEYTLLSGLRLTEREVKRQTDKLELLTGQLGRVQVATEQVAPTVKGLDQLLRSGLDQMLNQNERWLQELQLLASERQRSAGELIQLARDQNNSLTGQLEAHLAQSALSWDAMEKLLISLLSNPSYPPSLVRGAAQGSSD